MWDNMVDYMKPRNSLLQLNVHLDQLIQEIMAYKNNFWINQAKKMGLIR